jgi:hypothetical protein
MLCVMRCYVMLYVTLCRLLCRVVSCFLSQKHVYNNVGVELMKKTCRKNSDLKRVHYLVLHEVVLHNLTGGLYGV